MSKAGLNLHIGCGIGMKSGAKKGASTGVQGMYPVQSLKDRGGRGRTGLLD